MSHLSLDQALELLRGMAEPTRLRILALLQKSGELSVSDLVDILGQSQPRISRHLKLLMEAELVSRIKEGAWAFFRINDKGRQADVLARLFEALCLSDADLVRDSERLALLRDRQAEQAQLFFSQHATEWDKVRALHISESRVEAAIQSLVRDLRIGTLLDLGTGTGRMLELFAPQIDKGIGVDSSHDMLKMARANLESAGIRNCEVRHGDLFNLPLNKASVDVVIIHQVLHFLDEGQRAIAEAARVLRPQGRLIVVDFAPHTHEFLREQQAHRRLGFARESIEGWMESSGLEAVHFEQFLPPKSKADALTVSLWAGRNPNFISDAPSALAVA